MLRIILPFLLGVVVSAFSVEWIIWKEGAIQFVSCTLIAVFTIFCMIAILHRKQHHFGWALSVIMFTLGSGLALSVSQNVYPDGISSGGLVGESLEYLIEVIEEPQVKDNSVKVVATVSDLNVEHTGKVLFYFNKDSTSERIKYGQQLLVSAVLHEVENLGNPNEFNYKRYLRFHGISHRAHIKSGAFKLLANGNPGLRGWMYDLRSQLIQKFRDSGLEDEELSVASALILGYRTELDRELMSAYAGAGATHVLAVSGLHVGIVYVILNTLLKFLDRRKYGRFIKTLLLIFALFGYAGLTGLSASVFRAATMFTFVAIGKAFSRDTNIFNTLGVSAFVLVAIDPMIIMQVGFQLSYLAVIGIVLIQPMLFNLWASENRYLDWAWSITCVSIAAQIATAPLGLLYFHQFPNLFLVSNLLVIPAAAVILYLGFALFVFSFWKPTLLYFGFLLKTVISSLNQIVVWIEQIPYSVLSGIDISTVESLMIYAIIAGVLVFIVHKQRLAFYSILVVGIVFMAMQCLEVYEQQNQKFLTVYNVRGETAVALFNGTDVTFMSSTEFYENEQAMLFHVRHHWWRLGIENERFIPLNAETNNRSLGFGDDQFAILDLGKQENGVEVNILGNDGLVVILNSIDWNLIDKLSSDSVSDFVVSNRFGPRVTQKLKDYRSTTFVAEQGALIFR